MKIDLEPGTYIVAVSGGVDSMVLLDLVRQVPDVQFVVAHFDHGIRVDSAEDRTLVQKTAKQYGLPFVYEAAKLGPGVSEATARAARYAFLRHVKDKYDAQAILTAHHQDDMLETAILNILRGTGRKGLSSLGSGEELVRPLLEWSKKDIRAYASQHYLAWREDSTNADERYLRNYIRRNILTRFSDQARETLLQYIRQARQINEQIDALLHKDLDLQAAANELNRCWYIQLPYAVAREMMVAFLRRNGILNFDRVMIERLVVAAKTAKPGKLADITGGYSLAIGKDKLEITRAEPRKK